MPYCKNSTQKQFTKQFGQPIESYTTIQRATETLKPNGKHQYYCELPRYFMFLNQSPDQVIQQRKTDLTQDDTAEFYEKKTTSYAKYLLEQGLAGKTVACQIGRIQGFFSNNSRRYTLDMRSLKLPKARKKKKYSPSNEDVRLLYNLADSTRDRLIVTLMYQSGPAPIDIAALKIDSLPLESWSYFEFSRSKTGEIWRGVVTPDVSLELKAYLKLRTTKKEDSNHLILGRQGPLDSQDISTIIRELIIKSGLNINVGFKPTSLRDAFEDALVDANINRKIKEALMGHTSEIEQEYGGYNKMITRIIEAMKQTYPLITLNTLLVTETNFPLIEEVKQLKKENLELWQYIHKIDNTITLINESLKTNTLKTTEKLNRG